MAATKTTAATDLPVTADNFEVGPRRGGTGIVVTKAEGIYSASKSVNGKGQHARIVGWLVGVQQIPTKFKDEAGSSEKMCLTVETIEPTLAVTAGKPYVLPADARLLVPIGEALAKGGWDERATNEELVALVEMYPTHTTATNNGFNMQNWHVEVLEVKSRKEIPGLSLEGTKAALEAKKNTPQLAAASAS